MTIRTEATADLPAIYELIRIAFETAKVADGDEQDFAVKLRNSPAYIPELALVAEENGQLIGHIMLTKLKIIIPSEEFESLLLAPVSVVLECRDRGVGSALIRESMQRATAMGYDSVFLVGDPDYYKRFGFEPSINFSIKNINGIEDNYVMAVELLPGALHGMSGTVSLC